MEDKIEVEVKLIQKMREAEDKFIIETILPYCSQTLKREISKEELIDALENRVIYQSADNTPTIEKDYLCVVGEEYYLLSWEYNRWWQYVEGLAFDYTECVDYWTEIPKRRNNGKKL